MPGETCKIDVAGLVVILIWLGFFLVNFLPQIR